MKSFVGWSVMLNLCAIMAASSTFAQVQVVARACTKDGNQYNCDKANFEKILPVAKTVSVRTPRLQPSSEQLSKLVRSLGKTIRPGTADLTFTLARPEADGIYYGPSDRELAAIRVHYGANGNDPGTLVWVESYYGQPGTAWPIVVNHLTEQFREQFKR
ncbi:MAG: hypothetical protein WCA10_03390 [Terracidiphilus sp.]